MKKPIILAVFVSSLFFAMISQAGDRDLQCLVRGNSAFALDMYHEVRSNEGNIYFTLQHIHSIFHDLCWRAE